MLECALPMNQQMMWGQNMEPSDQLKLVAKDLRPVAQNIDAIMPGNHEERVWKLTSLHPDELLGHDLNPGKDYFLPEGGGILTYIINNKYKYSGVVFHGTGGGQDPRHQLVQAHKIYSSFDFIAIAHLHKLYHEPVVTFDKTGTHTTHWIRTGGFLFYPPYAASKFYTPAHVGSAVLFLGAKGNYIEVDVKLDNKLFPAGGRKR